MNPFYERFPETVMVQGKEYRIHTDFREFLLMSDILDSDVSDTEKAEAILSMYEDPVPKDYGAAMLAIADFVTDLAQEEYDQEEPDQEEHKKKLLSYTKDAPYIISDFLRFYGIDLTSCRYLHWRKFQLLLEGLPEDSEVKKRMAYRDIDAGKINDKDERARIIRIQRRIAIENMEADDGRIGDLLWRLM